MNSKLSSILLIILISFSCKKADVNIINSYSSFIIIGNKTNMIVNTYDTLLYWDGFNYEKPFKIDADNDHINDFRLISFNLSGPSMGVGPENGTSISCLNATAELLTYSETDTVFYKLIKDTIHNGSKINIYLRGTISCQRIGEQDSIIKIWDQNKIVARKINDTILTNERFSNDSITMTFAAYGSMPLIIYQNMDTTVYGQYVNLDQCNTLENSVPLYFGIRIGKRIGWIKLMIIDDYKILLMESAIAKVN